MSSDVEDVNDHSDEGNKNLRRIKGRERRFRKLLTELPDAVLVHEHGRIRYANQAAARLFGARAGRELAGRALPELVVSTTPVTGTDVEQQTLRRLDGGTIRVEARSRPFVYGKQRATQVLLREYGWATADTPQRRAEERLRSGGEELRDRAVILLDPVGFIVSWSESAERITGYRANEIIGNPVSALFTQEDMEDGEHERMMRAAIETGRHESNGWKRRRDGSMFYAAQAINVLADGAGSINGFVLLIRDLTNQPGGADDIARTEEQLRQAQRMEAVGRLATGIAHDFNNLLTAIQGHAQFLIEDLASEHPSRADAEEIRHSADRAAALTRQLLAFSRGQALKPQTIDLNAVVTSMEKLLRRVISEDIDFQMLLEPELWTVRADPTQIEQVVVNLIVNARDAMPGGGQVAIRTSNTELAASQAQKHEELDAGEYVLLSVSDTGVGMDHATQARIFEPFFTTKESGKGTGLGLSTVYGIVKQAGGHIFVYSEPGQGTTFKIYFPRADRDSAPARKTKRARTQSKRGEGVLVVEDNESVRALTRRVLEARGYNVLLSGSSQEALRQLERSADEIKLIITDVILPDMSGHSLISLVEEKWPHIRVLFMSGYTQEDIRQRGMLHNGGEFLEKPFTPDALARKVRSVLDAPE